MGANHGVLGEGAGRRFGRSSGKSYWSWQLLASESESGGVNNEKEAAEVVVEDEMLVVDAAMRRWRPPW